MPKPVRKKNESAKTASQKKVGSKSAPKLTAAQKRKAAALAEAIEIVKKDKLENRLKYFKPYDWQKKFYKAGLKNKQRMLMAANRVGKTACQAAEVAYHLTGRYPDWWEGVRFDRPAKIWCLGVSGEQLRDVIVKDLFGTYTGEGKFDSTGVINQKDVYQVTMAMGTPRLPRDVAVHHVKGNTSSVSFKSYTQGQHVLMGSSQDYIWIDEEPTDPTIYSQCITRTLTGNDGKGGYMALTMTPENGMTELVTGFMDTPEEGQYLLNVTWEDAEHLDEEAKAQILSAIPEYQRDMRSKGIPILGEGMIFPIAEEAIKCKPFAIPPHYKKLAAVDFGITHPTACVWTAYNPDSDTIYVYDIYRVKGEIPAVHGSAIVGRGKTIPVIYPHDGDNTGIGTGEPLAQMYMNAGVNMIGRFTNPDGNNHVEPGLMEMLERFRTGRLKVFDNLDPWYEEYRRYHRKDGKIHKKNDDLMDATRYAAISVTRFGQNEVEQQPQEGLNRAYNY
nr:terminase large subunit [uncultured Mediterranean phage uvMED]